MELAPKARRLVSAGYPPRLARKWRPSFRPTQNPETPYTPAVSDSSFSTSAARNFTTPAQTRGWSNLSHDGIRASRFNSKFDCVRFWHLLLSLP